MSAIRKENEAAEAAPNENLEVLDDPPEDHDDLEDVAVPQKHKSTLPHHPRRKPRNRFWGAILRYFWPQMGWARFSIYLWYRVRRRKDSSVSVANGLAFGAAVSFTPFIGLHLLIAAGLAWATRANVAAALIGTAIGNPLTFTLIWPLVYFTGNLVIGGLGYDVAPLPSNFASLGSDYALLAELILQRSYVFAFGGFIWFFIVYFTMRRVFFVLIESYRSTWSRRLRRRRAFLRRRQKAMQVIRRAREVESNRASNNS